MQIAVTVLCTVTVLFFPSGITAQASFQWSFGRNFVEEQLSECQTLPVVVEPLTNDSSAIGVPPYYLMAFEVTGIPTTTSVGGDSSKLSWQVNHRQGSVLMLAMIDSNGSTGGVSPRTFNVIAGDDTSCLPSNASESTNASANSSSLATLSSNLTDTLSTCQPWGLTVQGGQKPYTIVLSAVNSPVITNITMGPEDDLLTYIDRADPNGQIMASVIDATGQWGNSTGLLHTAGSNDTTCRGLVSSSGTPSGSVGTAQKTSKIHNAGLILGLLFGLGVPALGCIAFVVYVWRRRGSRENDRQRSHMYMPRPWVSWKKRSSLMESTEQPDEAEADLLISSKNADVQPVDDVSSARSTYNTSPVEEAQVPTPIGGKQGIDSLRPLARSRPIQDSPNTQLAPRRQSVHPHSSPSYSSGDLPPSYENVIAQQQATV